MADTATKPSRKKLYIIVGAVAGLVAFVVAALVVGLIIKAVVTPSQSEEIDAAVAQAKQQVKLPAKIDQVTTLTSIERGENATINYEYTLDGVDPAQVTYTALQQTIVPNVCKQPEVRKVLDKDIGLVYNYRITGDAITSQSPIRLTIVKSDCN